MGKYNQKLITTFILILNIPAAMSIDEHAPSLPTMMRFFGTDAAEMQLTITLYMLGMALSQWVAGALSDRFGRRPILLSTALIYLFGTVLCISSIHFSELLVGRFLQGVGSGVFAMISPALMGEALDPERVDKVSSYFSMSYALIPILAPVIGGYIQEYLGWTFNFGFMFIVALGISLFAYFKLPETHTPTEAHRLHLPTLLKSYYRVISNRAYITAVLGMIFAWASIIAFSILGPFILQKTLGLSPIEYGYYALLIGLGFLVGNTLQPRIGKWLDPVLSGLAIASAFSFLQLILMTFGWVNLGTVMIPTFLYMIGIGMVFPSLYGRAATVFTDIVGIASSLIGCFILIGAVALTALMTRFPAHSPISLSIIYLTLICLCSFSVWLGSSPKKT